MSNDKKQQDGISEGDNLKESEDIVDVLTDFNEKFGQASLDEAEAGSPEETENTEPQLAEPEAESKAVETEEPLTVEEEAAWLIDGKFKDNDEGKHKLAKAYREIQGRSQKAENALEEQQESFKPLAQLDGFLKENPDAVRALRGAVQEKRAELLPPPKPDDFDVLDLETDGTSSQEWFNNMLDWREKQTVQKVLSVLNQKEEQEQSANELKDMGLSSDELSEFSDFMQDPKNVTNKNLVKVWRILTQQDDSSSQGLEAPPSPKTGKQVAAASVSGSQPPAQLPKDKELEQFWGGIMDYNK
ncbi:hypothetical protein [Methylophaga sp.]|jgi:hypothetical protein|uniref:hypothetical protein n=1 Tax=Methylophaga sp. TaxID=2024840 RepID=UPI000C36F357|nr:hypothetical protein [Methylophaga sp.]MBP25478.1 hypothetical protein [Methylophaga sp.]